GGRHKRCAGASRHRLQGRRWRSRRFEPALVKLTVSRTAAAKLAAEVRAMISQSADPTELLTAKADPPKLTRRLVREAADNSAS
ncbi:MAG: hypothetical protein LBG11_07820, partial [Bifidobacteriaceae bacterium]|nr:hypothetical protein [Bifidobacteriaceae bacterium]